MPSLSVSLNRDQTLTDQIVAGIRQRIEDRHMAQGAKLPSIRGFAEAHKVSRFTVAEAYDRLVATGYVKSRRGSGFYVASGNSLTPPSALVHRTGNERLLWLIRQLRAVDETLAPIGGGTLPNSWLDELGIRRSLNLLARKSGAHLLEYGNPFGYLPLREHLALTLAEIGVVASSDQILLTDGVSHSLELIIRYLLKPGDAVLVDDPGYYNLFGALRLHGVEMRPVPRTPDGPDIAAIEGFAAERPIKAYFTQSAVHNPTSLGMSPHTMFRVLQAAERYGFSIVEDDIFFDFQAVPPPRLATLDHLNRVIYTRSFSKTISGSLRVGFIACAAHAINELADLKMLTAITTSLFKERLIYRMLVDGHYRKYLSRLRDRLEDARGRVVSAFRHIGLEMFAEPSEGMFLWARFPAVQDAGTIADAGRREGLLLAPGAIFRPHLEPSPWIRFNIANCDDARALDKLRRLSS